MFEIKYIPTLDQYVIADVNTGRNSLHSNGRVYNLMFECFRARHIAQKILDKYYPKLVRCNKHVWEHGDVFKTSNFGNIMMYHKFVTDRKPEAVCIVGSCCGPSLNFESTMRNATFLFNIKEKL